MELKPTKLNPLVVPKIWGGRNLAIMKGLSTEGLSDPIGETWEVSALKEGPSMIEETSLCDLVKGDELPYLVKFLDTADNLSVQVHPDDEYAKKVESSQGKTECWIILKSEQGSGIYLGLKEGLKKDQLQEAIESNSNVADLLNFYPTQSGDFYYVPAGTIHAVGKGVTLLEVQQSSGVTYRVWDWNRVDSNGVSRELHVKKALDVINFESASNGLEYFRVKRDVFEQANSENLISHPQFEVQLIKETSQTIVDTKEAHRIQSIISLEATLQITIGNKECELSAYSAFLIPIGFEVKINSGGQPFILIR